MNLIITGHGEHGKDTVCEMLRDVYGFTYESSSRYINEWLIYPTIKDIYHYKTPEECFADRRRRRNIWFQKIRNYNTPDKAALIKTILAENDIYCGLRNIEELEEARRQGVIDAVIWVDASKRLPPEPFNSCSITAQDCGYILDNNGTREELKERVDYMVNNILSSLR